MTPTGAILGPTIGTTHDNTGVIHNAHTQVLIHIILAMTLHTVDHLHTGAHQLTQEIAADHALNQKTSHQSSSKSRRQQGKTHIRRNSRVTIDDLEMDFYKSDDHSSDSEEDSDHLN